MIDNSLDFAQQTDLNQKRHFLPDPQDPQTRLITNILIYSSQYYPDTKSFAANAIRDIGNEHIQKVYDAFRRLYECIEREVIYGPSSSYVPASEIPRNNKSDISFGLYHDNQLQERQKALEACQTLKLDKIIPSNRIYELLWYNCSRLLSMKSIQTNAFNYKKCRDELQIDGENWLQSTPFSGLIVLLEHLLQLIISEFKLEREHQKKFKHLWARLAQLHNRHLKSPVKKLCSIVLNNYKDVLALSLNHTTFEDYIELLLQYSFSLLYYYKYAQCQKLMRHCSELLKMKIQFTGKLGRRTKYQEFDTPLLVMDLVQQKEKEKEKEGLYHDDEKEEEDEKIQLVDAKELVARERAVEKSEMNSISPSSFEEQSILLESPKFFQAEGNESKSIMKEIKEHHLLVALGIMYFEWRSTPHDEMLIQNITAGIQALLKYKDVKTSFSYNFALLLLRSLNEFPRIKNAERALDQLQKLKVSFNNRSHKDTSNLYSTPYETQLSFVIVLAEKYMEIGLSISAVELFEQAGLYEECIDGLIAKNFKEKALELALKLIDNKGKNPRLLCMLGDIKKEEESMKYYEQAWDLSKQTSSRAMRSLGWYHFSKNNFDKAAQCFSRATKASYYHPSTWFTLGCCYMRTKEFEKALRAFSECISIDETQGEAWGNMASCYLFNKKTKEAYSTLIQAVKYSESNWKLWANLLSVSLTLKQFYKFFESIQKVVKLGHHQILNIQILQKVVQIMKYQSEASGRKRIVFNYKNRIDRLFAFLEQKIGQNELVWAGKTLYQIELLEYYDIMNTHYHNLHLQNKLDPNDLVPDYQTIESTSMNSKIHQARTKARIVQSKQYELNMTMKVGWDSNKLMCQKVKKPLEEYVDIYRQYSTRTDKQDFKLFVEGVTQKIRDCLEEPYTVVLQWL